MPLIAAIGAVTIRPMSDAWLEELNRDECLGLLRAGVVGRIGVVVSGFPVVVPVNYRLIESPDPWLVFRTRPGGLVEQGSARVAFEIDDVDPPHHQGWSVLVRGAVRRLTSDEDDVRAHIDPLPWLTAERDSWIAIEPLTITGRRLHPGGTEWAFHAEGYL